MINFNYMSGYLAYKQIGDRVKANTEIKCLRLYKYSDVNQIYKMCNKNVLLYTRIQALKIN